MSAQGSCVPMNVRSSAAASPTALPMVKFVEISTLLVVSEDACDSTVDSSRASCASPCVIGVSAALSLGHAVSSSARLEAARILIRRMRAPSVVVTTNECMLPANRRRFELHVFYPDHGARCAGPAQAA